MDNEQQAAILALIITALKTVKAARAEGFRLERGVNLTGDMLIALENDAIEALESLPEVNP